MGTGPFLTLACLVVFTVIGGSLQSYSHGNEVGNDICDHLKKKIYHGHVVAPEMPSIAGTWISERCEIRPGPEFLLRKYKFLNTSTFEIHQYYYSDPDCNEATYSLVARGTYQLRYRSWTVPGGTEVDYHLSHVTVMPYTSKVARKLGAIVNKTCGGQELFPWEPYEKYELFNYVEFHDDQTDEGYVVMDKDCTESLDFSLHELQLLRLETRHLHQNEQKHLFLGDVHTDMAMRQVYRPTSYQRPLAHIDNVHCPVCQRIVTSEEFYPPILRSIHLLNSRAHLPGEWFSASCETRPTGMFLTRRIIFGKDKKSWEGYYYHFSDPLCREATFSIYARGEFERRGASQTIKGAINHDFHVQQVKITPEIQRIASMLSDPLGEDCGQKHSWRVGLTQDVTSSGGCQVLGIKVPHVEYEVLRVEKSHHRTELYLGQRPSDGGFPSAEDARPTSFQGPLVRCAKISHPLNRHTHRHRERQNGAVPPHRYSVILFNTLLLFVACAAAKY